MKTLALLLAVVVSVSASAAGAGFGDKKIKITTIPNTAEIWVNGAKVANGRTEIKVLNNSQVQVTVWQFGYVAMTRTYVNPGATNLPSNDVFALVKDPSIDSSSNTDIVNKDIDIRTDRTEEEAWRLISQIVTSAFDVIEVTDRNSGYMRTAWVMKQFPPGNSVRTRLFVKIGNTNPLLYKVKIVSEWAPYGTSPKDDHLWTEWDRLLRNFVDVVPEIQSRLAKSAR